MMNGKINEAIEELKGLPHDQQEIAAEAIMDFAQSANELRLSSEQVAEVERRLADVRPTFVTLEEARSRFSSMA
jgi:hypothetical protein